jgi:hypothetical protein
MNNIQNGNNISYTNILSQERDLVKTQTNFNFNNNDSYKKKELFPQEQMYLRAQIKQNN